MAKKRGPKALASAKRLQDFNLISDLLGKPQQQRRRARRRPGAQDKVSKPVARAGAKWKRRFSHYPKSIINRVFNLRRAGHTFRHIARELSIPQVTVYYWVRKEIKNNPSMLKRLYPDTKGDRRRLPRGRPNPNGRY